MPKRKPQRTFKQEKTATHKITSWYSDGVFEYSRSYQLRQFEITLFRQTRVLEFEAFDADENETKYNPDKWQAYKAVLMRFPTGNKTWPASIEVYTGTEIEKYVSQFKWQRGTDGTYAYRIASDAHLNSNRAYAIGWNDQGFTSEHNSVK